MFATSDQGAGTYDNLHNQSYDALFGSHYDSAKDEDYSEREDLENNLQVYKKDMRQKEKDVRVTKAEVEFLLNQKNFDAYVTGKSEPIESVISPSK